MSGYMIAAKAPPVVAAGLSYFDSLVTIQPSDVATINVAIPSGVVAGDRLQIFVATRHNEVHNTPAGWTLKRAQDGFGVGHTRMTCFEKVAVGTEGGTTVAVTLTSSTNAQTALAVVWRGSSGSGVSSGNQAFNASMNANSITAVDNSHYIAVWATTNAITPPAASGTNIANDNSGAYKICANIYGPVAAGATGTKTATQSAAVGYAAMQVEILA